MESNSFQTYRLVALGEHVSLVVAPPSARLQPDLLHFYLVPIKHAESFVVAASETRGVWEEVQRFQSSLNALYQTVGKGVLLMETVLAHKGFWQTRIEVVPIPLEQLQDAPIYFQSSMREQQQELNGTHTQLYKISSPPKTLSNVLPSKSNFAYFYV